MVTRRKKQRIPGGFCEGGTVVSRPKTGWKGILLCHSQAETLNNAPVHASSFDRYDLDFRTPDSFLTRAFLSVTRFSTTILSKQSYRICTNDSRSSSTSNNKLLSSRSSMRDCQSACRRFSSPGDHSFTKHTDRQMRRTLVKKDALCWPTSRLWLHRGPPRNVSGGLAKVDDFDDTTSDATFWITTRTTVCVFVLISYTRLQMWINGKENSCTAGRSRFPVLVVPLKDGSS